jgi:hypothetical protein
MGSVAFDQNGHNPLKHVTVFVKPTKDKIESRKEHSKFFADYLVIFCSFLQTGAPAAKMPKAKCTSPFLRNAGYGLIEPPDSKSR